MSDRLKNVRYTDSFLHEIIEENGKKKKGGILFPFTRYANILNRPIVTDDIKSSKNPEFLLVKTETFELDDSIVFELFGQQW